MVEQLRKAVGIGAIFIAAVSIKDLEPSKWLSIQPSEWPRFLTAHAQGRANLALVQAVACFLIAVLTPKPSITSLARRKPMSKRELAIAGKACRRIQLFVVAAYLAWSVYYLITALSFAQQARQQAQEHDQRQQAQQQQDQQQQAQQQQAQQEAQLLLDRTIAVNLNIIPSLLLFWLYLELAELTVEAPSLDGARKGEDIKAAERLIDSSDAPFHRVISLGVFALIVASGWYGYAMKDPTIINISEAASSCLNGVALALVIGRLGSKVVDPGSITLGLLYFYAVIQPTAAAFHHNPGAHLFATTVALPLKILLWLVIIWIFTTGILSEYVHDIRVFLTKEHNGQLRVD